MRKLICGRFSPCAKKVSFLGSEYEPGVAVNVTGSCKPGFVFFFGFTLADLAASDDWPGVQVVPSLSSQSESGPLQVSVWKRPHHPTK